MSAETEVARLIVRLVGDQASFKSMLKDAERGAFATAASIMRSGISIEGISRKLDGVAKSFAGVGRKLRSVGTTLSISVTAPITAMGAYAVKEFASFDQAMTEAFAKMDDVAPGVRQQMEGVAKSLAMSGDVAFDPTELAKGYEELASAGLSAEQMMVTLPITAKFAQAGAFDMGVAVKQLTGAMASFGITAANSTPEKFAQEMIHFSDVIVGVANTTTTGVEEVARALSADAAVAAKDFGLSLEETGAILGVYAMQNKDAEEAGNLTGRMLRLMGSSAVKNKKAWQELGVNILDSDGNFLGIADSVQQLEVALAGLSDEQRINRLDMLGFETLAQKSILPLIGMSGELRRQEAIYRENGAMNKMAAKQMQSFSNQMKVAKGYAKTAAIELGVVLAPTILQMAEYLKQGVKQWRALTPETKSAIVIAAKLAAGLSFLVFGLAAVASTCGWVFSSLSLIVSVVGLLFSPLGLIVGGLLLLGATLAHLLGDGMTFAVMWAWVKEKMLTFGVAARGFLNHFQQNMKILLDWVSERWASLWGGLKFVVGEVLTGVLALVNSVLPDLGLSWNGIKEGAIAAFSTAYDYLRAFVIGAAGFFSNFDQNARILMDFFRNNWRLILTDVLSFVEVLMGGLGVNAMVGLKILYRMFLAFGGWLKGMFKQLFSFEVLDAVLTGLIAIGEKIRQWGKAAWETIKSIFTGKDSNAMGDWLDKATKDIQSGEENVNLLETFSQILKQEAEGFTNPLEGFQSQALAELPALNFELSGAPQLILDQTGAQISASAGVAAPAIPGLPQGLPSLSSLVPTRVAEALSPEASRSDVLPQIGQVFTAKPKEDALLLRVATGIERLVAIGELELKKTGVLFMPAGLEGT